MNDWWTLTGRGDRLLQLRCRRPDGRTEATVSPVLTVAEVCRRLRKSRRQVYRYLTAERLRPRAQILGQWLFDQAEVHRFARRGLPAFLRPLFWDVPLSSLDVDRHEELILGRLLEFGDRQAIGWVSRTYPRDRLAAFVRGRGQELLTRRAWGFWASLLGVPPRESRKARWRHRGRHWGGVG